MKNAKSRNNKLKIILIILTLLLIATGFWVWKTIFNKSNDSTIISEKQINSSSELESNSKEDDKKAESKEACSIHEKLCFSYPETWSVNVGEDETGNLDYRQDKVTIVSPDKSLTLLLTTSAGGVGGEMCDPVSVGSQVTIKSKPTSIDFPNPNEISSGKIHAIVSVESQTPGLFVPSVKLVHIDKVKALGERSWCDVNYADIFQTRNVKSDLNDSGLIVFNTDNPKSYNSFEEAKKIAESETYNQALDILASSHYK